MANEPRRVLYFAENPLGSTRDSRMAAAVLRGLPPDKLLGFFEDGNTTPSADYIDRFHDLGSWRTPAPFRLLNTISHGLTTEPLRRLFPNRAIGLDLAFVHQQVARTHFTPEVVYFSGRSYRYLRLAVMAADQYDVPMVLLHTDDWMEVERQAAGRWGRRWHRRIVEQMTRAAARSIASTTSSPRLAARVSAMTGYRHVPVNSCCPDLLADAGRVPAPHHNTIPVLTYAGDMNQLQADTLSVLASAVTELNAEGTPVHLHIYTSSEFAPEADAIAVPDAVFYKGHVGREQLAEVYRGSDFLLTAVTFHEDNMALLRHSLSTELSEYLCAGKPVISMGHRDWHLHEYVQDHGCGFSILMDERFSRASIKQQIRHILSTDGVTLDEMSSRNRELWSRAHDVDVLSQPLRRALRLDSGTAIGPLDRRSGLPAPGEHDGQRPRRGVLWIGGPGVLNDDWVPLAKLKAVAQRLVDVFEHTAVDVMCDGSENPLGHPDLDAVLVYCHDVGLRPTLCLDAQVIDIARLERLQHVGSVDVLLDVDILDVRGRAMLQLAVDALALAGIRVAVLQSAASLVERHRVSVRTPSALAYVPYGWEPAGARWSLSSAQRLADLPFVPPEDLFEQIETLRRDAANDAMDDPINTARAVNAVRPDAPRPAVSPVQCVVNQLSLRVSVATSPMPRPVVWIYGSATVGVEVIGALERHPWLWSAMEFGGFMSSPGQCTGATLYGYPWRSIDEVSSDATHLIVVTSESSRLAIQEELSRRGWLDRMIPMFGLTAASHRYERLYADAHSAPDIVSRGDATGWASVEEPTTETGGRIADAVDAVSCATLELIERCPANEVGGGLLAHAIDRAWTRLPADAIAGYPLLAGSTRAA